MIVISGKSNALTMSLSVLLTKISEAGGQWSVKKVKFDKKENRFVAEAKNEAGELLKAKGDTEKRAVANLLLQIKRTNSIRSSSVRYSIWENNFISELAPIAEAYAKAPIYDPKAAIAFKALADDALHRQEVLSRHIAIEITANPDPYHTVEKMVNDIRKRRRLYISSANADTHPIWSSEQVLAFRTCFDILGYAVAGVEWNWEGDNRAFAAYAPLVSASAQEALFSEVVAQSAYLNNYRAYGPQKVAVFPKILKPVQEKEGVSKNFQGLHPSQSFPPGEIPEFKPFKADKDIPFKPLPFVSKVSGLELTDPNQGWESGVAPVQPNARLDYGDPLGAKEVMDNAQMIDTLWHEFKDGEGKPDYERMKQAVVNAFRVVLLSPRKQLKANAIHYQHISDIPAGVTDPSVYWNKLEKHRIDWNGDTNHMPYSKMIPELRSLLWNFHYPNASKSEIDEKTNDLIHDWTTEEQQQIARKDSDMPEGKKMEAFQVDLAARKAVTKRIKTYLKGFQEKTDHYADTEPEIETGETNPLKPRYPAFMGTSLKSISQIASHADDLLKAALEDVHDHDATGHHFRASVMQMGIAGVGMKVASFAWLMLQPTTSELATIDTHIMNVLGHNYEKDMSPREYGRFERELAAGRDAAGYGDMPLGAFQWGMWDQQRSGPGVHQDHSALKVVEPVPFDKVNWAAVKPKSAQVQQPEWWELTKPVREEVGDNWMKEIAPQTDKESIPYQRMAKVEKIAGSVPWFVKDKKRVEGLPDQSIMDHIVQTTGMSTPEVWAQISEAGH